MDINKNDTAVVVTDPQNAVLSEKGVGWGLVGDSVKENKTVENIERIFKAAKKNGFAVFISPHYYYPTDHAWKFGGAVETMMHDGGMFARGGALSLDGFSGSGADWLERYKPYIEDGKTVVASPHKVFGPETNDLILQLRKRNISKIVLAGMLALVLLIVPLAAHAQAPTKVYRIGFVRLGTASAGASDNEAFTQRLRELGYTEGQNLVIEWRFAQSQLERVPALVAELVQLQVDCLVVGGTAAIHAAKQATSTIPIVMSAANEDPVRLGLITSLTRPGGNITGVINIAEQLAGKRLELLKEAFPHIARVGHLSAKNNSASVTDLQEVEAAARVLGVRVQPLQVQGLDDVEQALQAARAERAEALIVAHHGFLNSHRERIVHLVDTIRLPVMYTNEEFVKIRGLMSYADEPLDRARRAATVVDKILKGAKPADLPVEQPTKFKLVINLKTAQALGITIPPSLLLLADEVIR
ncbi:MAG: ABC transporter substrate binding protein [Candidatus Entotheonellia bacterium]